LLHRLAQFSPADCACRPAQDYILDASPIAALIAKIAWREADAIAAHDGSHCASACKMVSDQCSFGGFVASVNSGPTFKEH